MPAVRTIHTWRKEKADFAEKFTFAMERHTHWCFDEMVRIAKDRANDSKVVDGKVVADSSRVQRDRLQVDVLKHRCAKLLPSKYGDPTRLEHRGPDGAPLASEVSDWEAARRIMFVLAQGVKAQESAAPPPLLLEVEPEPPSEARREPDVYDPASGQYISADAWRSKWPGVPPVAPPETPPLHATDEIVWLQQGSRLVRTDTRKRSRHFTSGPLTKP